MTDLIFMTHDLTDVNVGVIIHGVNCQGRMGSGVAFAIRRKWPKVYSEYQSYCRNFDNNKKSMLGMVQLVQISSPDPLYVANCFTQEYYGNDGKVYADLDAVIECLENAFTFAEMHQLPVYMPKIGCTRGGLNWDNQVGPLVEQLAKEYNIDIHVCEWPPI